ncbi:hypothetical protein L6R49_10780 [Myxococcota bacterium]|nr:hypothetical protein [Myxococcota bacterium]
MNRPLLALALAAALLSPGVSWAKEVAVAPMLAKPGLDPKITQAFTDTIAVELGFRPEYDAVDQLTAAPAGYNLACLTNAPCLKKVGVATGKDHLIGGWMAPGDEGYDGELVLVDAKTGAIIRTRSFSMGKDTMASDLPKVLRELLTGEGATKAQAAVSADTFDDEEEFDFDDASTSPKIATPGNSSRSLDDFEDPEDEAEEAARLKAEADAKKKAEAEAARKKAEAEAAAKAKAEAEAKKKAEAEAAAKRAAEEAARQKAEAAARQKAEADAAAKAAAAKAAASKPPPADDEEISFGPVDLNQIEVDISEINFGSATPEVIDEEEEEEEEIEEDDYADLEEPDDEEDFDEEDLAELDDLDGPSSSKSSKSSSSSSKSSSSSSKSSSGSSKSTSAKVEPKEDELEPRMSLTLRAGVSNYYPFTFMTYGGELSVPAGENIYFKIGVEGFATKRSIPPALQPQYNGQSEVWNTVTPVNLGVVYAFGSGKARPYIGADATVTAYVLQPIEVAPGLRVRGGVDLLLSESFALNVNANGGFWYGKEFKDIDPRMAELGLVPQLSVGTVFYF